MAIPVLSLLVLAGVGRLDVWKQNLQIDQLASMLSTREVKFTCDARVADRKVHVFAKQQDPLTIAKMTATTMGLKLAKNGSGWRFELDPTYEQVTRGHDADIRNQVVQALDRLISRLKSSPPKLVSSRRQTDPKWTVNRDKRIPLSKNPYDKWLNMSLSSHRDDVLWMLANCSPDWRKKLLAGHSIVGAVPNRPDCIPLPGNPNDYRYHSGAKQAYVILEPDFSRGSLLAVSVRVPLGSTFPNASSDHFTVISGSGGVFDFYREWSKLGKWSAAWDGPDQAWQMLNGARWNIASSSHGAASERAAVISKRPTIVEASPRSPVRGWSTDEVSFLTKSDSGWLLMKPPVFWHRETAWNLPSTLAKAGKPPIRNAQLALDWLANQTLLVPEIHRQYLHGTKEMQIDRVGLGSRTRFAVLWKELNAGEKKRALTTGLVRSTLSKTKQDLFNDSAFEYLSHSSVKGDVSGLIERSKPAKLVVLAKPRWSLRSANGSAGYPSYQAMMRGLAEGEKGVPHEGVEYTARFFSGSGDTSGDFEVFIPIRR